MQPLRVMTLPLQGTHLIEASAGTGKTYTIATLVLRLLLEQEIPIDRLLVVTFTKAAAAELRDRIRRRLRTALEAECNPDRPRDRELGTLLSQRRDSAASNRVLLERALAGFDEAPISTIHGFCQRVLTAHAFDTGVAFQTELVTDEHAWLDQVVRDFWARELYDADPLFVGALQAANVDPTKLIELARLASRHRDAPVIPARLQPARDPNLAPLTAAYTQLRRLWPRHRNEVQELLRNHRGLYNSHYRPEQITRMIDDLDAFVHENDPTASAVAVISGFSQELLVKRTRNNTPGGPPRHPVFEACDAFLAARKPIDENLELRHTSLRRKLVEFVRRELPLRKRKAAVQSFDDLLHDLHDALRRTGPKGALVNEIRGRYQAALIDEFQDTDPVQYAIFDAIYRRSEQPLFLIGDPKQAIYGFRGADVFAYLGAKEAVKERYRHTMDTNYRSDPGLLAALARLFDVPRPFYLDTIAFVPVQPRPGAAASLVCDGVPLPPFEIRFQRRTGDNMKSASTKKGTKTQERTITAAWAEEHLPGRVAADIAALLESNAEIVQGDVRRRVHAGDVAVLVRKNKQAQLVQAALQNLGIPSVLYGDASVLDTPECDELRRVLAAVAEPTHAGLVRVALATDLLGVDALALDAMNQGHPAWTTWVNTFRSWHALWLERGFVQMFRALLAATDGGSRLLRLAGGERRLTNVLHVAELLHGAATREHLGPAGVLRWLDDTRREDANHAEMLKLRLESDAGAVQITTVHRSKGLEYPIVYCPFAWNREDVRAGDPLAFHDHEDGNRLKLDVRPRSKDRHDDPVADRLRFELEAEGLRLLYVALTRARHRCVVVWGSFHDAHHSPLGYLLHAHEVPPSADPQTVAQRIKRLDDDALLATIRTRGGEAWTVSMLEEPPTSHPIHPQTSAANGPVLTARIPSRRLEHPRRTSSFTEMTHAPRYGRVDLREGRDHDQLVRGEAPPEAGLSRMLEQRVLLAEFPRGATVGNAFHELFEELDPAASPDLLRTLVQQKLALYGLATPPWPEQAALAIERVLAAPLLPGGDPLRLADIPRTDRLTELGFVMPVAPDSRPMLNHHALANVFRDHPGGLQPDYHERVRTLGFQPLRGYLKGFIDLVVRVRDRYYLIDYKTNHLGNTLADYGPAALARAMAVDHYVLQSHIYTLALVRHLTHRKPDFDYEREFGGVLYLFVRGMTQGRGEPDGVHFDRPPHARIEALSRLFPRPGRERGRG